MTLPSEVTRVDTVGGTAVFYFNFKTLSTSHVEVYLDGVLQSTGFAVALNENQNSSPGGTVTFIDPPGAAVAVRIQRRVPRTQTADYTALSALRAESLETALDKLVMQTQEVERDQTDYVDGREAVIRADFNVLENAAATLASATASASAASASASAAASSETNAAASQVAAEVAKDLAEAAQTAALIQAGLYDTEAAGRAAVSNGQNFKVKGSGEFAAYEYRRIDASTSTLLAAYPAVTATNRVDQVLQGFTGTDAVQPIIADLLGGTVMGLETATGRVVAALKADSDGLQTYSGTEDVQPVVVDSAGTVLVGINKTTGALVGGGLQQTKTDPAALAGADLVTLQASGWNGLIVDGQSLACGSTAQPPISTTQAYSHLTFGSGPRSAKAGNAYSANNTSPGTSTTKALIEDTLYNATDSSQGETVLTSAASWAVAQAIQSGSITAPTGFVIFASCAGRSSYTIAQLNKAAAWYGLLYDQIAEAKARATAAGKTYVLHAVVWMQGEADAIAETAYATYKAALVQLQADIQTDAQALTGQTTPVHLLTYQVPTDAGGAHNLALSAIQRAQEDASRENSRIHMVGPVWHLFTGSSDNVHLSALGQLRFGRYVGRAYKQLVVDGVKPDRIRPISAVAMGTTVLVRFTVPVEPLVLDSVNLLPATDQGFKITDGTGTLTLSNIKIVDPRTVQITVHRALGSSPVVRFGLDYRGTGYTLNWGATGNLRDSTTETHTYSGTTYPLWHVCPGFQLSITSLEA